jgi:single-stranded-DNA-specific exonuclease
MEKKWVVAEKISEDIVSQLLYNRNLKDKNAIANFFNPPTPEVIVAQYPNYLSKIDLNEVEKAIGLIKNAIDGGRPIIIHGDYDVDGICGTAILYQTLKELGANVTPFIPDRFTEGYGLSISSIDKIQSLKFKVQNYEGSPLLITTDCGISAVDEVKYAKSLGFTVIITDHHAKRGNSHAERDITHKGESLPEADAIVWTDELAGAGVAYLLASRLAKKFKIQNSKFKIDSGFLDLVALATIADVQPLTGVNRSLVKYGLEELNRAGGGSDPTLGSDPGPGTRVGLKELIKVSGLENKKIGTYEVSWMLGPRLNASGRLQNAMDSLKLLITDDPAEAQNLAAQLNHINQERQQITQQTLDEARSQITQIEKILVLQKETWHEGVIGLVAGKIKEEFYRPAVVIAKGEKISRGSARSVEGFNIVKMLRQTEEFLIDAGGHQMAAGFTIETAQIPQFQEKLLAVAGEQLSDEALTPVINIDTEVSLSQLDWNLLNNLKKFEPFGVGNPKPTFLTQSVRILNIRTVGNNGNHLKLTIRDIGDITGQPLPHLPCIGFGFGEWAEKLSPGDLVDIVYNLEEDTWNGERYLQLKLKDLRKSES